MTLLASEENLGRELKGPPTADDLVTVSTRTDDVSCRLCPPERRGPAKTINRTSADHLNVHNKINKIKNQNQFCAVVPETLALNGLPTMCWGPPYLMEIR